jgi:hypothetical protein
VTGTCQVEITFDGTTVTASADKITCNAGQDMTVIFNNTDDKDHQFDVYDIRCKGTTIGKDPSDGFVGNDKNVDKKSKKQLKHGLFGLSSPSILTGQKLSDARCPNPQPSVYKYSIRVGDSGNSHNNAKYLDPDLEVP